MHLKRVKLTDFKRFTDTSIEDIPRTADLVVLTGPNGSGKSAVFEAFNYWRRSQSGFGESRDTDYFPKKSDQGSVRAHRVDLEFHEDIPGSQVEKRKLFYIRSAYRNEPDFQSSAIQRQQSFGDQPGPEKLIQTETRVRENYERLVSLTIKEVYEPENDEVLAKDLREKFIGKLRQAMLEVFGDLVLDSPGDPIEDGTFFFTKGSSSGFHYKNLSGGEKAGFDLLLDFIVRAEYYTNTVFCIDEPELHMGSQVQAKLLRTLMSLLPDGCQLWVATHSLGMMREALKLHQEDSDKVAFLDTYGTDFDEAQVLAPRTPNRDFWKQVLQVALDDVASLVGPEIVLLCESDTDLDSDVYSRIFSSTKPNAEFISVGNSHEVIQGGDGAQKAIGIITPGTAVLRVVDRDDATAAEIEQKKKEGIRVLSRRNIESFLFSDEILKLLAEKQGKPELKADIVAARNDALARMTKDKATPSDDFKKAGADLRVFARNRLGLTQAGTSTDEFKRAILAPLITPDTTAYKDLEKDLFE